MSTFSVFSFFFLLFLLSNFPITEEANTSLIPKTCKKCIEGNDPDVLSYNFCVTSLLSAKKSRRSSNLRQLCLISMNLIRHNATSTKHHIKRLLKNKRLNPFVKSCLSNCEELYSDSVSTLKKARRDFRAKRDIDASVKISAVGTNIMTCEDMFAEWKLVSPLTKRNHDSYGLSAITMCIMSFIRGDLTRT